MSLVCNPAYVSDHEEALVLGHWDSHVLRSCLAQISQINFATRVLATHSFLESLHALQRKMHILVVLRRIWVRQPTKFPDISKLHESRLPLPIWVQVAIEQRRLRRVFQTLARWPFTAKLTPRSKYPSCFDAYVFRTIWCSDNGLMFGVLDLPVPCATFLSLPPQQICFADGHVAMPAAAIGYSRRSHNILMIDRRTKSTEKLEPLITQKPHAINTYHS